MVLLFAVAKLVSQFLKILQNPHSNSSYIIIEVTNRVRCEIIKYEVVQLVARGDLQDPSAYANGKRLGSRKLKEQSQNTKKAYTVMQAHISIDSWKVMDAHLQTIKQKGTQDEYFGVAND